MFILISNHQSWFDFVAIKLRFWKVKVMISDYFMRGILKKMLESIGGFPALRGTGKSLDLPKRYLKEGYHIMIFPEGHLIKKDERGTTYPGARRLSLETGVPILPIYTEGIKIKTGKPFHPKEDEDVMLKVWKLKASQ